MDPPPEAIITDDPWTMLRRRAEQSPRPPRILWRWLPVCLITGMLTVGVAGRVYHVTLGLGRYAGVGLAATVLYGLLLTALLAWSLDRAACRSRAIALALGLLAGSGAFAAEQAYGYGDAVNALSRRLREKTKMEFTPRELIGLYPPSQWWADRSLQGERLSFGHYCLDMTGWGLGLVWLGQAGLLAGLPAALLFRHARHPLCPYCRTRSESLDLDLRTTDTKALGLALVSADWTTVRQAISGSEATRPNHSRGRLLVRMEYCPQCRSSGGLSVIGQPDDESARQIILDHLPLDTADLRQLLPAERLNRAVP